MYVSAMKYCGCMELCGLGFPREHPIDYQWPEVLEQIKAQKAGAVICWVRESRPEEDLFLTKKGFIPVSPVITNPRTGNKAQLYFCSFEVLNAP